MKRKHYVFIGMGICLILAAILIIVRPGMNQTNTQNGEILHREEFTSEKDQNLENPTDIDNDSAFIQ